MTTKKITEATKATLNYANISTEALEAINRAGLAISALAERERDTATLKKALEADYSKLTAPEVSRKDYLKDSPALKETRKAESAAREKATALCTAILVKYQPLSVSTGDMYTDFDVDSFLKSIGVLTEGDKSTKIDRKIDKLIASVCNRVLVRRKKGENKLTIKEYKNSAIDLLLAIILAIVESGAVEYNPETLKITVKTF